MVICAHETHCEPQQLGRKGRLLSRWQCYTVGAVVRQADLVFTSTPRYTHRITQDYHIPPEKVRRLPIGSNLPTVSLTPERRARLRQELGWRPGELVAVTFGSFASQLRALRSCGTHLARGVHSGQLDRITCIGGSGPVPPQLADWARGLARPEALTVLGYQSDQRIAEILACCDFGFSAYPPALLGKSGVFSAFAGAGLAVLVAGGSIGDQSEIEALPFIPTESWDWSQARSPEVERLRQAITEYARDNLDWPVIARRALAALQPAVQPSPATLLPVGSNPE
jgi:hypothetical protein